MSTRASRPPSTNYDLDLVHKVASLPIDLVLEGENGVGKDTLARYIHDYSGRLGKFVHVNCAAIPDTLIESEFFGVEAGAYTGATKSRPGKIEIADGGTLYLDEIDSIPTTLQAKLLTTLQERGCERLGSHIFLRSNFRVIASTKTRLQDLVDQGRFRIDLYHRLNVVTIGLSALRHTSSEILQLFENFTQDYARQFAISCTTLTPAEEILLLTHDWPGNIRELKSAACRFVLGLPILTTTPFMTSSLQGEEIGSLKIRLQEIEKALILCGLRKTKGNLKELSIQFGLALTTLAYRIKVLGIELPNKTAASSSAINKTEHAA